MVAGGYYDRKILQNAATAIGDGSALTVTGNTIGGMATATFQVAGITTATVTFEATVDGSNWIAVQAVNLNSGTAATTATANGLYRLTALGLISVRARISAYTSGTITVTAVSVS